MHTPLPNLVVCSLLFNDVCLQCVLWYFKGFICVGYSVANGKKKGKRSKLCFLLHHLVKYYIQMKLKFDHHYLKCDFFCPCLLFVHRLAARWWWPCSCTFWQQTTTGSLLRVCTSTASSLWPFSRTESIYGDLLWLDGVSSASFTFYAHDYNMIRRFNILPVK